MKVLRLHSGSVAIRDSVECAPAPPASAGALVMGADYRGLALARSLGRCGVVVWIVRQDEHRLAASSRYARRVLYYPSWNRESAVSYLIDVARTYGLKDWRLFPTADDSVRLVASHHEELSEFFRMTVPPWEELQWAVDKRLMQQLAAKLGIDHPRTFYPQSRKDLLGLQLTFPALLKPATRDVQNRLTFAKAWRVDHMDSLLDRYDEASKLRPSAPLMIQELIPGGGESQYSYAAACQDGHPIARVVARRTRQYPMEIGRLSTFVETIEENGVVEPAERFLRAIRYSGMVELEFKKDSRTNTFKLLDVNPRVWGWYSLCERAGVNIGYLLWRLYQGEPLPKVRARSGVRWIRLTTDVLTALREIRSGRMHFWKYLRSLAGPKESAIFAVDDPTPGLLEVPLMLVLLLRRLLHETEV